MSPWQKTAPITKLIVIQRYSITSLLPASATRPHLLIKFFARALLFWRGAISRKVQIDTQFINTIATASIAEKLLNARLLTAISTQILFFYQLVSYLINLQFMAEQAPPQAPPAAQGPKPAEAGRGFGRGADKKGKRPERKKEEIEWKPVTKLGRLVKAKLIENIVDIFRFSIPIKEQEIVDAFLGSNIKEEVMEVKSVQKQTQAGQRTRFKAYAIVGDERNYLGLGWKCHKEVQGAIKGAVTMAKLNIIPVRKGYWGNKIGGAHTVPCKVTGKSGSVKVRLVPAPRGTGLVAPPVTKKLFNFAGIHDIYTKTEGSTRTRGNFVKACFSAIKAAFEFNSPDWWGKSLIEEHPFIVHRAFLENEKVKN